MQGKGQSFTDCTQDTSFYRKKTNKLRAMEYKREWRRERTKKRDQRLSFVMVASRFNRAEVVIA